MLQIIKTMLHIKKEKCKSMFKFAPTMLTKKTY